MATTTAEWALTRPEETDEDDVPMWLETLTDEVAARLTQVSASNIRYTRQFLLMGV